MIQARRRFVVQPNLDNANVMNGVLGWSVDPGVANSTFAPANAATLYLQKIALKNAAISVTNITVEVQALAGSTLTHSYLALYKSDGTFIAQTADQSAVWNSTGSTGVKTVALVGGPFACTPTSSTDFVWAALYCGTKGGTMPTFVCASSQLAAFQNFNLSAATTRVGSIAQADTATLASIAPASIVQENHNFVFILT